MMVNDKMEDLKKVICKELELMGDKRELSAAELDFVYKLIVSKEKLLRIEQIEEEMGSSNRSYRSNGRYANSERSYAPSYAEQTSGRHYVGGHYSRDAGGGSYSMADARHEVSERIRKMMDEEMLSENDRRALREAYEQMQRN